MIQEVYTKDKDNNIFKYQFNKDLHFHTKTKRENDNWKFVTNIVGLGYYLTEFVDEEIFYHE